MSPRRWEANFAREWTERFALVEADLRQAPEKFSIVIGDSLAQEWYASGDATTLCGSLPVVNLGYGGMTLTHYSAWLQRHTLPRAELAYLLIGMNDAISRFPLDIITRKAQDLLDLVQVRAGTVVVILEPRPVHDNVTMKLAKISAMLATESKKRGMWVVDASGVSRDARRDGIHLNGAAYRIIEQSIREHVCKMLPSESTNSHTARP
jgi:lysophospholipase L1-like esterase